MSEQSLIVDSPQPAENTALADLRSTAMNLPAERMQAALAEYADRRQSFRDWLLAQLVEGLHYGYVPGTEPKFDAAGNMISSRWDKKANDGRGGYISQHVSPKSWQAKRCLYKAGAEFIVDLMGVRGEYAADVAAWQQLGGQAGNFVIKCKLVSRATGEHVGEGIGARKVGTKGGDENNAVKMAQKSALVAAVLNSYGLSDLFTQDLDDKPPAHDNPEPNETAPRAKPRSERKTEPEVDPVLEARRVLIRSVFVKLLKEEKFAHLADMKPADKQREYRNWVRVVSGHETIDPTKPHEWGAAEDEAFKACDLYFAEPA